LALLVPNVRRADTSGMEFEGSLSNQLLIAMPGMLDPNFNSTVTLICEHNADGALGIMINRPLNLNLGGLFSQLDVKDACRDAAMLPVMSGGPVARDRGFVLHEPDGSFESSVAVSSELQLTLSRDVLDAIATGRGPLKSLIALGYAGWEAGQLETEMLDNTWLSVPASNEIVFDVPFADRWVFAARMLGIDISRVSPHAGHA
jgi:putative transcriptional regulator